MVFFRSKRPAQPDSALDPWQLLRQHADALAGAARGIYDRMPDARLCGIVVAPDAPRGNELRALLAECHGDADPNHVCVGIVPRAMVGAIVHDATFVATAPQSPGTPALPVVVATAAGTRVASVPCARTGFAE
jgi:hypothetical protein